MTYTAANSPSLVGYNLTSSGYTYLKRLLALGLVEGTLGDMRVADAVQPIVEALHTVLAGGEVEVRVVHKGNPDIVHELRHQVEQATADANAINEKSGYYVTLS